MPGSQASLSPWSSASRYLRPFQEAQGRAETRPESALPGGLLVRVRGSHGGRGRTTQSDRPERTGGDGAEPGASAGSAARVLGPGSRCPGRRCLTGPRNEQCTSWAT